MRSKKPARPAWWLMYLGLGVIIGLLVLESRMPISETGHAVVQIGIVVLMTIGAAIWLHGNAMALDRDQRSQDGQRVDPMMPKG